MLLNRIMIIVWSVIGISHAGLTIAAMIDGDTATSRYGFIVTGIATIIAAPTRRDHRDRTGSTGEPDA